MDLKDLLTSTNKTFKSRITNPFFGAFIITWILINWKIVLYLLYDMELTYKIDEIENLLKNDWNSYITPLISSTVIVIIYPVLGNLSHWLYEFYKKWRISVDFKINENTPMRLEEAKELRKKFKEMEESNREYVEFKDRKIEILETDLDNNKKELNKVIEENDKFKDDLKENKSLIEKLTKEKEFYKQQKNELNLKVNEYLLHIAAIINYIYYDVNHFVYENYSTVIDTININHKDRETLKQVFKGAFSELEAFINSNRIELPNSTENFLVEYTDDKYRIKVKETSKYGDIIKQLMEMKILMKKSDNIHLTNIGIFYLNQLRKSDSKN